MLSKKQRATNNELVKKATADPAFREALLKDPQAAIKEDFGVELPPDKKVFVHQNTENEVHYVLPPVKAKELSEEDLQAVAGGNLGAWSCSCHPCLAQCT